MKLAVDNRCGRGWVWPSVTVGGELEKRGSVPIKKLGRFEGTWESFSFWFGRPSRRGKDGASGSFRIYYIPSCLSSDEIRTLVRRQEAGEEVVEIACCCAGLPITI